MQRVTAIALVPLSLWFVIFVLGLVSADYATLKNAVAQPYNAVLLLLLLLMLFYHAILGLQVVIEDYISGEGMKIFSLLLMKFVLFALAASTIFSVLKIAFGD